MCINEGSGCKQNKWTLVNSKAFIPTSVYSQNQKENWRSRFQNCTGSRGNQEAGRTQVPAAQAGAGGDAPEISCPPHTLTMTALGNPHFLHNVTVLLHSLESPDPSRAFSFQMFNSASIFLYFFLTSLTKPLPRWRHVSKSPSVPSVSLVGFQYLMFSSGISFWMWYEVEVYVYPSFWINPLHRIPQTLGQEAPSTGPEHMWEGFPYSPLYGQCFEWN